MFRFLRSILGGTGVPSRRRHNPLRQNRCRLLLEALEDRTVPTVWTNAGGDGLWSNPDNWSGGGVPGVPDTVMFGYSASTADCIFDLATATVDRVQMGSDYTGTLTIGTGNTLTTGNYFLVGINAGLALNGNGTVNADTFYVGGDVTTPGAGAFNPARLVTTGSFFLQLTGSITASGGPVIPGYPAAVQISAGNFDDGGTITVGTPALAASCSITGGFYQVPFRTIDVNTGSALNFLSGGMPSAYPMFGGTVNMFASTINTDTKLFLAGGSTLNSWSTGAGAPDTIGTIGGVGGGLWNLGTVNWLNGFHALNVGGAYQIPPGAETPGTLNMRIGAGGMAGGPSDFLSAGGGALSLNIHLAGTGSTPTDWFLVTAPDIEVFAIVFPPLPPGSPGWDSDIVAGGLGELLMITA